MVSLRYTTRLSICPIRSRPSGSSEMISQLLFGEEVELLQSKKDNWLEIRCLNDGTVGWIDAKQMVKIEVEIEERSMVLELVESVFADAQSTLCTLGAELPDFDGMTCRINDSKYRFSGQAIPRTPLAPSADNIEKIAKRLLNTPELSGGRSPFGLDASGYAQLVFKCNGIDLPRSADEQVKLGETVDFIASARVGDLAFFTMETEQVTHVGIILGNNLVIHCSGYVRIDNIEHYGIYNSEINQYTYRLKIIKRLF